jgi:hypothetical protein
MFKPLISWKFRRPDREAVREFVLRKMPTGGCAEIGVKNGDFSAKILEINRPTILYLIDPWFDAPGPVRTHEERYQHVCGRFAAEIASGRIRLIRETSESAPPKMADASLEWVYIDGNHRYEFVKRDLELYFAKVKPGGYIVCDDYHYAGDWFDGATRAVDEIMSLGTCRKIFKRRSQFVMQRI